MSSKTTYVYVRLLHWVEKVINLHWVKRENWYILTSRWRCQYAIAALVWLLWLYSQCCSCHFFNNQTRKHTQSLVQKPPLLLQLFRGHLSQVSWPIYIFLCLCKCLYGIGMGVTAQIAPAVQQQIDAESKNNIAHFLQPLAVTVNTFS